MFNENTLTKEFIYSLSELLINKLYQGNLHFYRKSYIINPNTKIFTLIFKHYHRDYPLEIEDFIHSCLLYYNIKFGSFIFNSLANELIIHFYEDDLFYYKRFFILNKYLFK